MKEYLRRLKEGTQFLNYGREIIAGWTKEFSLACNDREVLNILDLGCGHGDDLANIKKELGERKIRFFGIESYEPSQEDARRRGIEVANIDLERSVYPYPDDSMDVIIANQIIEHTKEIFWIFSECSRILRPEGVMIVGVPNLASLHNRMLLLSGDQPSSIELLGPHVRGITLPGFRRFIEADNIFKIESVKGSNFYPFPPLFSRYLSRLFPRFSVSLFVLIRKIHPTRQFREILVTRFYQTNFFTGNR